MAFCPFHVERNITQPDIAESLGGSRPSITEALKIAGALGIVKITIPRDRERQPSLNRLQTAITNISIKAIFASLSAKIHSF